MTRRTDAERSSDQQQLMRLFDMGADLSCAVSFAMSEFGISRSAAFRDCAIARDLMQEDPGPTRPNIPTFEFRDATLRLMFQALLKAEKASDLLAMAKVSKEIRSLLGMGAIESSSPTKDYFLVPQNDPTTPPSTNDEPNTTTPEHEAVTSGDWKGYFDGWTESPD